MVTSAVPLSLWALGSLFDHLDCSHLWVEAVGWWLTSLEARWEEEDSLLTDNESYANQLATTPCANMAIVDMKGLLHGWHQRAFIVEPRIKTIFILTRYQISTGLSTAIRGYLRFALIYNDNDCHLYL